MAVILRNLNSRRIAEYSTVAPVLFRLAASQKFTGLSVARENVFTRRCIFTSEILNKKQDNMAINILNVAEKNDAAKNLSEIMSNGRYRRREGLSKFNKIYEFEYRLLENRCKMVMTSVSGHLLNMDFAGTYRKWNGCHPIALFDAPISKECTKDFVNIKRTLEREIRQCTLLVIWTDGDREGENIGFEVIEVCKAVKPNLQVYRARFSEITQQAITRACRNLGPPDQRQSDAVYVRRELDLRIGAVFTRFQTLRLKRVFPDVLSEQLISYGSCQFPTLGFVVERYKQMQNFIPETFWKIKVSHKKGELSAEFAWDRIRLFDHTACLVPYMLCLENSLAKVIGIQSRNKSKWRPLPLDTVEMEKLGSRKLHITAKEIMRIAEKLYTQGFISYPRTETNIFPKELDLGSLVQIQTVDPNWGDFAANVLTRGANARRGTKTDNAHPPIHPLKYTNGLQGNEKRVYEFIVRHFLACVSDDAKGKETTVQIEIAGEKFVLSGLIILERNYLEVYPYDKWNSKEIPHYEMGEMFQPTEILMVDGETTAPSLLTEADLIALMDKHGIGTDATHADHIEKIKARLYVGLTDDKRFVPGELGMGLVEGYDRMGFEMSKPHLRAELEADLKRICDGVREPDVVLREQLAKYKDVFSKAAEQANKIDDALAQYFGQAQQVAVQPIPPPAADPRPEVQHNVDSGYGTGNENFGHDHTPVGATSSRPSSIRTPLRSLSASEETNAPVCTCGQPALQLTVKKEGSNCGRKFYKCGNMNACKFFLWADDGPQTTTARQTAATDNNSNNSVISCKCDQPANLLTVQKEGSNTGRKFFTCCKPREQGCGFFQWADASAPAAAASAPQPANDNRVVPFWQDGPPRNDGPFKKPRLANGGTTEKRKRRCGLCGQEGHNRKSCPTNR